MGSSISPSQSAAADEKPAQTQDTQQQQQQQQLAADDDAPEAKRTALETASIVGALCIAVFLAALDMTIITTATPAISAEFDSTTLYVFVGTAYMLANAAFAPTWGKISDIFGRKPVLLAAVGVFWVGSLVCGLSHNVATILAGRAVQGLGGGGVIVLANICIGDLFSVRSRGLYYGIFGCAWAIAGAVGPVVGGAFTSKATWRWCFYINLPVSGAAFLILLLVLRLHNPRTPLAQGLRAIDWLGSLLVIGGTLMLLLGLEFGGVTYPWSSPTVVCLVVFGAATIALFGVYEALVPEHPVMPARLFRSRSNVAALAFVFAHGFTFIAGSYWLPLYFQAVLGVDALMSGVYLLPYVLGLSLVSIAGGVVIQKTGNYKMLMVAGAAISTLGFGLLLDLSSHRQLAKLVLFELVAGIGVGCNFQSPLIALHSRVQPRDIATTTSIMGFMRQLATAVSVVVGGVVFSNGMQDRADSLREQLGPGHDGLVDRLSGANAAANVETVAALTGTVGDVVKAVFWASLRDMFILYTVMAGLCIACALGVRQHTLSKEHKEHKTGLEKPVGEAKSV